MALLTLYWSLDGILIISSLMVAAYFFMTRKFNHWSKRGISELPPTPFVGNFMDCLLSRKSGSAFVKDVYDYGEGLPFLGFYVFDKPYLLVRDPELVKYILVKDFNYFPDKYATADEKGDRFGYANVVLMKNPGWKSLRPKLSPAFTPGKLKQMFELMLAVADDLGKHLDSLHLEGDGKAVEFKDICANFTTDTIGITAFGLKLGSLENPKAPFREYGRKIFHSSFHRNMESLIISFSPQLAKYLKPKFFGKKATNFLRYVFCDVIEKRVDSGQKRNDLIDVLIEIRKTYKNDERLKDYKFDGDDLLAQAAILFAAGFETSSTTMSFTLYELALNPDVQKKLRAEIQDALEETGGKITYDMITTLPYLDMVISESLRKYPAVAYMDRMTLADYKVPNSDLVIEKGTPIFISIMGLHYDSRYFSNPEKFDPLRFTEEVKSTRPSFAFLPFGGGPRSCIGMRLGLMQSKLGIVQILKDYEVSPCEKTKIPIVLDPQGIITTALGGVQLNIRKIFKMALLTLYWSLDVILILSSLIVAAYLYVARKFNYWSKRGVKGIPPTPFVGNFMDCLLSRKSGLEFLRDLYDYGKGLPFLGFYVFDKPHLLVRDPELVKHVLVRDFDYFSDRYATTDEKNDRLGYASVVLMKNPGWKSLRPKLSPVFTPGKLKTMFDSMLAAADDLGKHLDSLHLEGDGKVVEFKEISANFITDMIGSIMYGLKIGALENPKAPFRKYGRKIFHSSVHRNMELLIISFLPQLVKYLKPMLFGKEATNFFRPLFWNVIEQRVDSGQKRNDLIDILIEIRKTYKNDEILKDYKFDGDDLVAQAIVLFIAGTETSSTAMSFTLHELAANPDVQKTLRAEIHDALAKTGGKITYDMITTLPYLDMVISESLRKYPSVAQLDRITLADYKVPNSDLVIEKGTPIFISIMGLHNDSRYFPNPEKFDPLRFTEEAKSTRPSSVYLPFGGGPHGCIGMRLGLIQSKLGVVQVLKDYEVSPCEKTKTLVVLDPRTIITTALGGVELNIRKITTAVD
ncbi:uncharacterized protein [Bombus fervidus]|uniref:uncharacterized protein n=1 Tax=Bombus fervidus TaxID=203811 RepID=UPI003AB1172F